jgi:signal recognition particle subunit SEC65
MDPTGFFVIYPSYLDSSKTMKQGRRIGVEKAVDTPTVQDLSEALAALNIRHVSQPHKGYSRDQTTLWDNPGRVKVDPQALESGYTKRSLLVELASIAEELPSRIRRLEVMAAVAKLEGFLVIAIEQEEGEKEAIVPRTTSRTHTRSGRYENCKTLGMNFPTTVNYILYLVLYHVEYMID